MAEKFDWMGRPIHKKGSKPHSASVRTPIKKTTTKSRKPKAAK